MINRNYKDFNIKNLVNAHDMVHKAKNGKYAVGQFNINNLEWTRAALEVAQELNAPIILGVSEGAAKYFGGYYIVMNVVSGLMIDLNITVPVAVHLDHGSSFEVVKKAVNSGLTSIMIDGSSKPLEENIKMTKEVVELCHSLNISVEGEVGTVGGEEDGVVGETQYAHVDDCIQFTKDTKLDFFAASLGSVHGHYKGEPKLAFDRMAEIRDKTGLPLVLHGGTGIPDDMIKKAISCGEAKININTECQDAFSEAIKQYYITKKDELPKGHDPRVVLKPGINAVKEVIRTKMKLFGCVNKA